MMLMILFCEVNVDMKNTKIKKSVAILICAAVVIVAVCLYIVRAQSVAGIISINRADLSSVSITVLSPSSGGEFIKVFASKDTSEINEIVELLSSTEAHLFEWRPLTGTHPVHTTEGTVFVFMINDEADYHMLLDYANGSVYYNNCKYRVSTEDVGPFLKGLETICSEWKKSIR